MRDIQRIERVIAKLKAVWYGAPDQRLGQLLINILNTTDIFYIEDSKLEEVLDQILGKE